MIKLENISKIYKMGDLELKALDNVTLEIKKGEFVAIMGPSGSGKSTLMNIIGFLDTTTHGKYYLEDTDITKFSDNDLASIRNSRIGFIFQSFNLLNNLTASGNVELPLVYSGKKNRKKLADDCLDSVGLDDRKHHRPKELSGGQQQRVAIARALANDPSIIMADEPTGALDSKTGVEIMALLRELNNKGITVIIVTHDSNVASYADRIIHIRDGKIAEDIRNSEEKNNDKVEKNNKKKIKKSFFKNLFLSPQELLESFIMAIYSIATNKMRTFLTMLGVIIGVASVIGMIAMGMGAQKQVTENISSRGANLLSIMPGGDTRGAVRTSNADRRSLKYEDALELKKLTKYISAVDVIVSRNYQIIFGNRNYNSRVQGATSDFLKVNNFEIETGSFFTEDDNRAKRRVAVIGNTIKNELFPETDPIGQYVKISKQSFQIVGVLKEKGSSGWRDEDEIIVAPILTMQKRLMGIDFVNDINVSLHSLDISDEAEKAITAKLRELHEIRPKDENDFRIRSMADIIEQVNQSMQSFTMLLAGIAVVSLVVGGIGIMNIMLVSVTERTREIGIRKAIGARKIDILSQFLIEALLVSVTGGIIGIMVGYGISEIVRMKAGLPTEVSYNSVMMSFFFSMFVGLFFGFYPARKASKLNPIDALRYE
ncbi:MAG: ABC transporter permease [Candidatus Absconditabacterales bacterium]|nr:ABC transporter permease [Candidatus Absconditabacterales bacterium]